MTKIRLTATLVLLFFVGVFSCPSTIFAKSEKSSGLAAERHVTITRGKSKVIKVDSAIADVLVADPSIIEVGALKSNRLYLIGAALGDTNIMIFDSEGDAIEQLDVHVRVDEDTLQHTLESLFPDEKIIAKTVNDDVMLTGSASNPATAARIEQVAARFAGDDEAVVNMMSVAGEQQVMLKVKVLEVSRNILNELGLDLDGTLDTSDVDGIFNTAGAVGLTAPTQVGNGSLLFNIGEATISSVFRALERDGYISTLAEPNLAAISGENARFLAGGEFPIPTEIDDEGNVTYEYKPFGVSLAFKPVVMSKNRINLNVSTEVSNISNDFSFELESLRVPGFDVRRAETSVEMPSGGTLMLAGLIESNTVNNMNRIPGIKNVPIIGDLTGSESFQRNETELVIMISSYLVNPFAEKEDTVQQVSTEQDSPLYNALVSNLQKTNGTDKVIDVVEGLTIGYLLD